MYPALHAQPENGHRRVQLSAHPVLLDTTPASARRSVRCAQQACMLLSAKILACTVMLVHIARAQQLHVVFVQEDISPYLLPHSVRYVAQALLRQLRLGSAQYVPQTPIALRVPAAAQNVPRALLQKKGPLHVIRVS